MSNNFGESKQRKSYVKNRKNNCLMCLHLCTVLVGKVSAQDSCRFASDKFLPVVISAPAPPYPTKAIVEKIGGDVLIDVSIDASGKVTEASFFSGNELFKKAALETALKWRFNKTNETDDIRNVRITFTFFPNLDNYEEQNVDEITYKYH